MTSEGSLFDAQPAAIGRYQVLHQLGAGSLGPVFRANDPKRRRKVAIKWLVGLPPERADPIAAALRALVEAAPDHPAAVRPLDAGVHDDAPFLVSVLAPGQSLDAALREFGPAAIHDALPRLRAIAEALDAAAHAGICHGDLNPRDILVSADETLLTGIGIAPAVERAGIDLPRRRPYSAPEVLDGGAASAAADQFAFAAIAFEWLFGRRVSGAAGDDFVLPALPGVAGARLAQAFQSALAIEPRDRFGSCVAFVDAVEDAAGDPAAGAEPAPPARPATAAPGLPLEQEDSSSLELRVDEESPDALLLPDPPVVEVEPVGVADAFRLQETEDETPEEPPPAGPTAWDEEDEEGLESEDSGTEREPVAAAGASYSGGLPEPAGVGQTAAPTGFFGTAAHEDDERGAEKSRSRYGLPVLAVVLLIGLAAGALGGYFARSPQPAAEMPASSGDDGVTPAPADPAGTEAPLDETPRSIEPPPAVEVPPANEPAPAPAAPVVEGRLLVRTTPAGAAVAVDGRPAGETPLTLRGVPLGTRTIRVTRAGFAPVERQVALTRERPSRSLEIRLTREAPPAPAVPAPPRPAPPATPAPGVRTGTLEVVSRPAGATVTVNGRRRGETPLTLTDLAPGVYTVRLERPGYRAWETQATVTAGVRARVGASLQGGQRDE